MKSVVEKIVVIVLSLLLIWWIVPSRVYAFMNPTKTETEVILHTFKSMMFDFSDDSK